MDPILLCPLFAGWCWLHRHPCPPFIQGQLMETLRQMAASQIECMPQGQ